MQEFICLAFKIVFNAADTYVLAVHDQIGCPWIPVVRKTNTTSVSHYHAPELPYIRTMNVSIYDDGRIKKCIGSLKFFIAGLFHRCTPQVVRAGVDYSNAYYGLAIWQSF